MFGVFSAYEQQVIFDWIAGEKVSDYVFSPPSRSRLTFEAKHRFRHATQSPQMMAGGDFDAEERLVEERFASAPSQVEAMAGLIALMSPELHHTAPGLAATRLFNEILG